MRILLVDDSPYDRELTIRKLRQAYPDAEYIEASRQDEFDAGLQLAVDIVLVDYQLKFSNGLTLLAQVRNSYAELPVIMVTDTGSELIATEGMKNGLNDYVLKKHLSRLPLAIKESLEKQRLRTQQHHLEEQLRQAQKMESLGLLVSGIAHDFNNILGGIAGYADRSLAQIDEQHALHHDLQRIYEGAQRATRLTRQLLSFSRQQSLSTCVVQLNTLISSLLDFLHTALGTAITLEFQPEPHLSSIMADSSQVEQIIVNLCINARDAMPDGGRLSLATRTISIAAKDQNSELEPGPYVQLIITDTGTGMSEQVRARIFEPFFTTKDIGKGTGLGLFVVYGIIKQHGGTITVDSVQGQGTSFTISLPAIEHAAVPMPEPESRTIEGGYETVLLVEDDPDLQQLMRDVLHEYGYSVLLANDGEEGLALFRQQADTIGLIVSDLMMPRMKGSEFRQRARRIRPAVKFLFVSGYQEPQLNIQQDEEGITAFLQKPFDLDDLAAKVRELLD